MEEWKSRKDLNGRAGVATSFDHDHDQYVVGLDDNEAARRKGKLRLKSGNLAVMGRKQEREGELIGGGV